MRRSQSMRSQSRPGRLSPSRITVRAPTAAPGLSLSRRKATNGNWNPVAIDSAGEREFHGCRYGTARLAEELELVAPPVARSACQSPDMLPVAIAPRMAEIYRHVGDSSLRMNDLEGAMHFHFEVLKLAVAKGDMAQQGRTYAQLGSALYNKGCRLPQAALYFERAFEIGVEIGDTALAGISCGNLAWTHDRMHNVAEALHHHHTARMLSSISGHSGGITCPNCALATGYHTLGDPQSLMACITRFQQQLVQAESQRDRMSEACAYGNLAAAYYSLGDDESRKKAVRHHSQAQQLMSQERKLIKQRLKSNKGRQCQAMGYPSSLPPVAGKTAQQVVARAPWTPHLDETALGKTLIQVEKFDRDKMEGHCRRRQAEGAELAKNWLAPRKQTGSTRLMGSLYSTGPAVPQSHTFPAGPKRWTLSSIAQQELEQQEQEALDCEALCRVKSSLSAVQEVAPYQSIKPLDDNARVQADLDLLKAEEKLAARLNMVATNVIVAHQGDEDNANLSRTKEFIPNRGSHYEGKQRARKM